MNTWQKATEWVEAELGGTVVDARHQGRWRAAWYFDLERGSERLPLYFRGTRPGLDQGVGLFELEMNVLRILEDHGIPVPHVYGLCPDPIGIVMDRCPGRPNLATADSQAERESVLDQYIDALAAMHGIDLSLFEKIGMRRPSSSEDIAFGDLARWEASYRQGKCRPEPLIEFVLRWLKRNAPADRSEATFLHADSGQFIFEEGRLTALLDFELAYLGDPAADLAGMRCRDTSEPLGDLGGAFRRYEEKTGRQIDLAVVDYHTIRFMLVTPMSIANICAKPPPRINLPQYLGWYLVYGRIPLEIIAKLEGVELEAPVISEPSVQRHTPAYSTLTSILEGVTGEVEGKALRYELDTASRLSTYLERIDSLGPSVDEEDREELAELLGHDSGSWPEADAELETLILSGDGSRDEAILRYLYRRYVRQEALLGPVLRELEGARLQLID